MARTSNGPRYFKSKNGWFGIFNGERLRLTTGPKKETEAEAREKYDAEMAARKVETTGDRNQVWAILNAYLHDLQNRVKNEEAAENTYRKHYKIIVKFNEKYGALTVRELRPQHVTDFIAIMRQPRWHEKLKRTVQWGHGTDKICRDVLQRAFRWATDEAGIISKSPFDRAKGKRAKLRRRRPSKTRTAIYDAEHELLLDQAMRRTKKGFAHLLVFLHGTGARPAEMYLAAADEWNEEKRAFIIKAIPANRGRYKLAHLGEDRTVYIPSSLVPLAKELMQRYPTGPIFRTGSGKPWKASTICARFRTIKRAASRTAAKKGLDPIRKEVTAYSYRHAFVTRWVEQGRHLEKLCELLNTSEAMVRQHYSHLFERTESLRGSLEEFDQGKAAPPATSTKPGESVGLAS